jgi:DNA-directed RNA polymerase specialized sigma24 family protein
MTTRTPDDLLDAAVRGARSVRVRGWISEECEGAALEALVRRPPGSAAQAYLAGRSAALDELRRLSGYRREARAKLVPLDVEVGHLDPGFVEVEERDLLRRLDLRRLTSRERQAVLCAALGLSGVESAAILSIDPSRVSELLRAARAKLGPGSTRGDWVA